MEMEPIEEKFEFYYYVGDTDCINLSFTSYKPAFLEKYVRMCKSFANALGYSQEEIDKYFRAE